jgi:hypothetical protein
MNRRLALFRYAPTRAKIEISPPEQPKRALHYVLHRKAKMLEHVLGWAEAPKVVIPTIYSDCCQDGRAGGRQG